MARPPSFQFPLVEAPAEYELNPSPMSHNKYSSTRRSPPEIVAYRYNEKLMYVPVGKSYSEALSHARDAFPQLKGIKDSSLALYINVVSDTERKLVGITAAAWPKIASRLLLYEVIDVQVAPRVIIPKIIITAADDEEPAPPYHGQLDVVDVEKSCPDQPASSHAVSSSLPNPAKFSPKWILSKLNGS